MSPVRRNLGCTARPVLPAGPLLRLCLGISETYIARQLLWSTRSRGCAPLGSASSVKSFTSSMTATDSTDTATARSNPGQSFALGLALSMFLSPAGALAPHAHRIQHPFQLLQPRPTHPLVHPPRYHHIPSDLHIMQLLAVYLNVCLSALGPRTATLSGPSVQNALYHRLRQGHQRLLLSFRTDLQWSQDLTQSLFLEPTPPRPSRPNYRSPDPDKALVEANHRDLKLGSIKAARRPDAEPLCPVNPQTLQQLSGLHPHSAPPYVPPPADPPSLILTQKVLKKVMKRFVLPEDLPQVPVA